MPVGSSGIEHWHGSVFYVRRAVVRMAGWERRGVSRGLHLCDESGREIRIGGRARTTTVHWVLEAFVVRIAVGREGLRYRSRKESGGLNGNHTVWPIWSRGFEMKLPGQAEKPKFIEIRAPRILPFYKIHLKMLKRPKKQPFSELSGKYLGNRGWKPA